MPEGRIFLLNLAESIEIGLVDAGQANAYGTALAAWSERSSKRWWLNAIAGSAVAKQQPAMRAWERLATIVSLSRSDALAVDPVLALYGASRLAGDVLDDDVLRAILIMKSRKKLYWVTEQRSIARALKADEVRDLLGLDWADEDIVLYRVDLDGVRARKAAPLRPSGLCRGSARFKARRHDERHHRAYKGWGRTVDLAAWRTAWGAQAFGATGACELVAELGPLDAGAGAWHFVGETEHPSGCNSDADHLRFAEALLGDRGADADDLHRRVS